MLFYLIIDVIEVEMGLLVSFNLALFLLLALAHLLLFLRRFLGQNESTALVKQVGLVGMPRHVFFSLKDVALE